MSIRWMIALLWLFMSWHSTIVAQPAKKPGKSDPQPIYGGYVAKLEKYLETKFSAEQVKRIREVTGTLEEETRKRFENLKYLEKHQPEIRASVERLQAAIMAGDEPGIRKAIEDRHAILEGSPGEKLESEVRAVLPSNLQRKWEAKKKKAIDDEIANAIKSSRSKKLK